MSKKEGTDSLEHCPNELDINHYNLSFLFCSAAIGIDNYLLGRMKDDEYRAVIRTGKILYQYAEDAKTKIRKSPEFFNPIEDIFLLKILEELDQKPQTLEEVAKSTMQIGLDFIKMKELPRKR